MMLTCGVAGLPLLDPLLTPSDCVVLGAQRGPLDGSEQVDETQAGLDDERVARLEREAQSLKRVGEDIFRLQEKLDLERVTREQTVGMMQVLSRDWLPL
eukprot:6383327-Pyramimonas_sp.AAC.1